jgi:hypothetical protein
MVRAVLVRTGLVGAWLAASVLPARADGSVLVGATIAGSARPTVAVSFGHCPSLVGFEIEYSSSLGSGTVASPIVGTITGNVIVQSKLTVRGLQFYGSGGIGLAGETTADGVGSGEVFTRDIGGGVKIGIAGPLRLRIDYRVFLLGDAPDATRGFGVYRHPQHVSAGRSVAF